jgi:aspartate racemase
MATVGLVGGLGPESTVDYYRRIIDGWKQRGQTGTPSIVIDSLDAQRVLRLSRDDRDGLTEYLSASLARLESAGVDFAALTANTPHLVFDDLSSRCQLPLISIVEVCAQESRRRGYSRVGLLGTIFTMDAPFYPSVFARHGVDVVTPRPVEKAWLHERYVTELLNGVFRDDTRDRVHDLGARLRRDERVDGIVLGGTELPLLLTDETVGGVPVLDTTRLHVDAIVGRLIESAIARGEAT